MFVNSRFKAKEKAKDYRPKIIGQRKAFYWQTESSCARKEIADIDIAVTSRNGERNHVIYQNNV